MTTKFEGYWGDDENTVITSAISIVFIDFDMAIKIESIHTNDMDAINAMRSTYSEFITIALMHNEFSCGWIAKRKMPSAQKWIGRFVLNGWYLVIKRRQINYNARHGCCVKEATWIFVLFN